MAITTLDGVVAGAQPPQFVAKGLSGTLVAGRAFTPLFTAGLPGAAAVPTTTPGLSGAQVTSLPGQIPFTNPASGYKYLSRFSAQIPIGGVLMLCDLLWWSSNTTVTSTSEQVFTGSQQIPARDMNGSNNGEGVYGAVIISATVAAGTPTLTLKYTDSTGTTGQSATNTLSIAASAATGTFHTIGLAAGDTGIRRAESITQSATMTSGSYTTVLYRPIATLEMMGTNAQPSAIDAISGGMPRLYDNTVPFLVFIPGATTSSYINASVVYTEG